MPKVWFWGTLDKTQASSDEEINEQADSQDFILNVAKLKNSSIL